MWYCEPDITRGTCDCETEEEIFAVEEGKVQTIIGMADLQPTISAPSAVVEGPNRQEEQALVEFESRALRHLVRFTLVSPGYPPRQN